MEGKSIGSRNHPSKRFSSIFLDVPGMNRPGLGSRKANSCPVDGYSEWKNNRFGLRVWPWEGLFLLVPNGDLSGLQWHSIATQDPFDAHQHVLLAEDARRTMGLQ